MNAPNENPNKAANLIRAGEASGNTPPPDISKKQSYPPGSLRHAIEEMKEREKKKKQEDDALLADLKSAQEEPLVPFPEPYPGPMAAAVEAGLKVAHKRQPELTTMASLSAMAAICGSFCQLWDGSRLNLYFLGIAPTGAGKDAPFKLAKKLARSSKPIGPKLIDAPASGEGLEDVLASNVATYCAVDEIAHFFCVMNDAKAPAHMRNNARRLLAYFSAGDDVIDTRALAGKTPRTIPNPAFNLLGFTTPEKMGGAFNPDDFTDGLAGRILFVITETNPPLREVETSLAVPKIFEQMAERVAGRLTYLLVAGTVINRTDDAKQLLVKLNHEFDEHSRNSDSWESALAVRSSEKLKRIAGVLAMFDDPDNPIITIEHVRWAAQFVRASNSCVLRFIGVHMEHEQELKNAAKLKELLHKIIYDKKFTPQRPPEVKALKNGCVASSMLLRVSKLKRWDYHRALDYLEEIGDVEIDEHQPMTVP